MATNPTSFACTLPYLGFLEVSGSQAEIFLQGQLTIDVKKVTTEALQFGGYCNLKGRLHSVFYVIRLNSLAEQAFLFCLPKENLPHFLATLQKFAIFSKVTLKDASSDWMAFGIQDTVRQILIKPSVLAAETKKDLQQKFAWGSPEKWLLEDVQAFHPWIFKGAEEKFLPHHLNLPQIGAVDFKKGCYVGQEIVARMEYLSKNKKDLYWGTALTTQPLTPASSILPEGEVVYSAPLDQTTHAVLAVLPSQCSEIIHIDSDKGLLPLIVEKRFTLLKQD